ncbi:MAG: hypothetical protein H7Y22_07675 [Gemmatimonadaceae bacterium]|nr:hypothetical protein [Gloeobacterales cyanobacterium ES-bin-141]
MIVRADTLPVNQNVLNLKRLIWLYFWLLIFEGALRKWFVPQLSTPLLVVRDPVVLLLYYFALREGMFPKDLLTKCTVCLAYLFAIGGLFEAVSGSANPLPVMLFGLRTDFLHLPLIFLIPKVLEEGDIRRIGWWFLVLAAPMALLMVLQFQAPPTDFLNIGVGEGTVQLGSALGKIRPPGTFSYISGPVAFYGAVSAFLFYGFFQKGIYSTGLLFLAGGGLLSALAVSGSRSALGAVISVAIACGIGLLVQPRMLGQSVKPLLVFGALLAVLGSTQFFNDGLSVTNTRLEAASANENTAERFLSGFFTPLTYVSDIPLLGRGLGFGTNAGAAITGGGQFSFGEGEWARVLNESGPVLGLLYLLLRMMIAAHLGWMSVRAVFSSGILALALFGACALNVVDGQFGQPTTLGFTVFGAGLCLAASRVLESATNESPAGQ